MRGSPPPFPSPFDALGPHPLAREAALALQEELRLRGLSPGVPGAALEGPDGGKMLGVLVARDAQGQQVVLRAFSGLLAGSFLHPGWAPPAFDSAARAEIEPAMEAAVLALTRQERALRASEALGEARELRAALEREHAEARLRLRDLHLARRRAREQAREALIQGSDEPAVREAALHALAQESRGDKAEKRRLLEALALALALAPAARRLQRLERRLAAIGRLRAHVSRRAMRGIHDTYRLTSASGERRGLRELFAPQVPPSGAGDCAGVKLLVDALSRGLTPLAMAEFWWGAPPPAGGRVHGAFYPACREKCGPLLPFLLEGLEVAPPRTFTPAPSAALPLRVVYRDAHLIAVDKPHGLLSVPGRSAALEDSVLTRLRDRLPEATGPLLVHRLDLDTSGLLLAALDAQTHRALQRQFLTRGVKKRYRALLEGLPTRASGEISLPLRVDVHDRPRQIHDPVHGRAALTRFECLDTLGPPTEVALFPVTGRTHQLRVHAAHPLGLGTPIVGDRLYGHAAERLMLHAERLEFVHPVTGVSMALEVPAPFASRPPSPG